MLGHMSAQDIICSKNDQTIVEICTVVIYFNWLGHLSDQTGICTKGAWKMYNCYFILCVNQKIVK